MRSAAFSKTSADAASCSRADATAAAAAALDPDDPDLVQLGHPNFDRTDIGETLWALARSRAPRRVAVQVARRQTLELGEDQVVGLVDRRPEGVLAPIEAQRVRVAALRHPGAAHREPLAEQDRQRRREFEVPERLQWRRFERAHQVAQFGRDV